MSIIIMVGPQGSGKGTQADLLAQRLKIPHINMGGLLRAEVAAGSDLGRQISAIMAAGELVPTDVASQVLKRRLENDDAQGGVVFDGFPRNMEQDRSLEKILSQLGKKIEHVIYLNLPDAAALERLAGRRVCTNHACETNYHIEFNPPRVPDKCDRCGSPLVQRHDDTPEVINKRLAVYHAETKPLIELYSQRGLVREIDASQSIAKVADDIKQATATW